MKLDNGYEVPEGMESMSCFHNCGFIIIWAIGNSDGVGERMDDHHEFFCPATKHERNRRKGK